MKKSLLALAVLGAFAGAASAQSSVTIYGSLDLGITKSNGGTAGNNGGQAGNGEGRGQQRRPEHTSPLTVSQLHSISVRSVQLDDRRSGSHGIPLRNVGGRRSSGSISCAKATSPAASMRSGPMAVRGSSALRQSLYSSV